jgi:serine/threonine-protein phosphatase 2A regulatory subunit A
VPSFLKLLRDGEAEVRVAAAGKVAAFCKLLGSDTVRLGVVRNTTSTT